MSDQAERLPLVSVILPTYRRDDFLRQALASALGQTYPAIEVIVSDSAASKITEELVAGFADERVRYRCNPQPLDSLGNHVAAIAEARGEYVAVLHDDDAWHPGFLDRMVGALTAHPDCVLAFCDPLIIDERGVPSVIETDIMARLWNRAGLTEGCHRPFWSLLLKQAIPMVMGTVFRRDRLNLGDVSAEAGSAFDLWLTYLLCRTGEGAYYVPDRLARYRLHVGAETARPSNAREGTIWVWEQLLRDPELINYRQELSLKIARAHQFTAVLLLRRGERKNAYAHAFAALYQRFNIRSSMVLFLMMLPPWLVNACITARIAFIRGYLKYRVRHLAGMQSLRT